MATIQSISPDDHARIQWISTNGNEVTFRVDSEIVLKEGAKVVLTEKTAKGNLNFPVDIPELHIEIQEDANGSETLYISESITVTMSSIYEEVAVKLVVKEDGNYVKEQMYWEQPGTTGRGDSGPRSFNVQATDIGPPDLPDELSKDDFDALDAFEDIGPPE